MDIHQESNMMIVFKQVAKLHHQTASAHLSGKEVYPGQPPLLRALIRQDGQSQKELAEKMNITPATLNVMIGRMEKTGLVERQPDLHDQRISRVYVTEKGKQIHQQIKELTDRMEKICFDRFTVEEKIVFRRLLLQMYDNLKLAQQSDDDNREDTIS